MKNIKIKTLFLVALSVIGLTTGCNKNSGNSDVISVAVVNNGSEYDIIKKFADAYLAKSENANKTIKIIKINEEYDSYINKRLYVNQMPDIIQVYDYSSQYWTNEGIFLPLDEYIEKDEINLSLYYASSIEMARSSVKDEKMYWVPRDYNKVVCAYNKAIFDIAGVAYPSDDWTYDDFITTCQEIMAKKDDILAQYSTKSTIFYAADMTLNWQAVYYPAIKSFGGDLIDKENSTAFKNIDTCLAAVNKLLELADDGMAVPPTSTNTSAFSNRQCAMKFITRPDVPNYIKNIGGNDTIDFVSMPSFNGVETSYIGMGCTGYAITSDIKNNKKEAAWDFLKFIFTEEGQELFASSGSGEPVLKSITTDPNGAFIKAYPNKNNAAFTKYEERDIPMNFMDGFKPNKQLGIYVFLMNNMLSSVYKAGKGEERETYFKGKLKTNFEKTFN